MRNSIVYFLSIFSLLISCKKADEKFTTDSNARLTFSRDTVFFDTLFTSVPNITKRLLVYNNNKNAVKVSHIALEGLANSPYTLIINGKKSFSDSDIEIRGNDSIFILISVFLRPTDTSNAYVVSDKILFNTNGNIQSVALESFAQNANFLINSTTGCDTTWTSGKPFVVYDKLTIPEGCSLTIDKGTKVLFHNDALLQVNGTLVVKGEKGKEVLFGSDKKGKIYEDQPGQWKGITFSEKSRNNKINYAIIENGETGIDLKEISDNDTIPELILSNSILRNMESSGLYLNADTYLWNDLVYSTLGNSVLATGRNTIYIRHSTFAGYSFSFFRDYSLLDFSNFSGLVNIENSIFWGDRTTEVIPGGDFRIKNSVVKGNNFSTGYIGIVNKDPRFKSAYNQNFRPDTLSPAINSGVSSEILKDLDDKSRDASPDIGAYEH